jgi:repressor LexA
MDELTDRQQEVLDFIAEIIDDWGMPPTVAEIADGLGLKSTNGVRGHLQALERKGVIELIPHASRGIRLLTEEFEEEGIPVVGRVAAGSPILATQHIEEHYPIDATRFRPRADYLLRVFGMSMRDAGILSGDLLAVHRAKTATNGQIVVARIEEDVTVKRFNQKGSKVRLKAENPDFEDIVLDLRKADLVLEGIAVGLIRQQIV